MKATSATVLALVFGTSLGLQTSDDVATNTVEHQEVSNFDAQIIGAGAGINQWSLNPNFAWQGQGEAWKQSQGYKWQWTGIWDGTEGEQKK